MTNCERPLDLSRDGSTPEITYYVYDSSGSQVGKVTESHAAAGETPRRIKERIYAGAAEFFRRFNGQNWGPEEVWVYWEEEGSEVDEEGEEGEETAATSVDESEEEEAEGPKRKAAKTAPKGSELPGSLRVFHDFAINNAEAMGRHYSRSKPWEVWFQAQIVDKNSDFDATELK
jgi:hypothetical protein